MDAAVSRANHTKQIKYYETKLHKISQQLKFYAYFADFFTSSGLTIVAGQSWPRIPLRRSGMSDARRRDQELRIQPVKLFPLRLRHLHGLCKPENL